MAYRLAIVLKEFLPATLALFSAVGDNGPLHRFQGAAVTRGESA
jgi:hypothetical protein